MSPPLQVSNKTKSGFVPQVGHDPNSPFQAFCPLFQQVSPSCPAPLALVQPHLGKWSWLISMVERHPANQSLHGSAMFKCHPVPRCLRITIIRGCSLKIRAQFFKKQIAQSDVLAAVRNIYGLRACAVSSSLSFCAGDGPTAPWTLPSRDEDAPLPTAGSLCPLTSTSTSGRGLSLTPAVLRGFGQRM